MVFSFGFFIIFATSSFTSLMNCSATPGCVCSIVTQIWMLWTDKSRTCTEPQVNLTDKHYSKRLSMWFYLDGNWRVLRFQPFDVSALDKRNISNTLEPKATTETSGFPNTNSPSTLRTLRKKNQLIKQEILKMQRWRMVTLYLVSLTLLQWCGLSEQPSWWPPRSHFLPYAS